MRRGPDDASASDRARWLAQVAEGLEEAQRLLWRLDHAEQLSPPMLELYGRIETVRAEVESLRLANERARRRANDPEWMKGGERPA